MEPAAASAPSPAPLEPRGAIDPVELVDLRTRAMSAPPGMNCATSLKEGDSVTGNAHPHDMLFKALMAHRDAADALLRERLPPQLVALLADGPPDPAEAAFIDDHLRGSA